MTDLKEFRARTGLFAVAFLALLVGYHLLLLSHAPAVFRDTLEDMSYGWYVPVFSLYVVWRERKEIVTSFGSPSVWGIFAMLPFAFAGFLGARGAQIRLEIVGFVGMILSLTWTFFGWRTMKRVLFPAGFLLFCLPLHTYLDVVTIHLRMFAVSTAQGILEGSGVDIVRNGTMLGAADGSFSIDVADPCSGMRSLFAMMALTAGYAYFTQPTWFRRGLLFALSIPIAIIGNAIRILTIVVVALTCSSDFATGFYHDYSGYMVFLVSILLMVAVGGLITKVAIAKPWHSGAGETPPPQKDATSRGGAVSAAQNYLEGSRTMRALVIPIVATVLFVAGMVYQAKTVDPVLCEPPDVRLAELPGYTSEVEEVGEVERTVLPPDTQFDKRRYEDADGRPYGVTLVIGGRSKSSIHRPELCLPAHGFQMQSPRTIRAGEVEWHVITLARGDAPAILVAYTFFNQEGYRTSSHLKRIFRDVWDRSIRGRIDRWVMAEVLAPTDDEEMLCAFLKQLEGTVKR